MKKKNIASLAVATIVSLASVYAVKATFSSNEVFNENVEVLADGEYTVYGHCQKIDNFCIAVCPACNALLISVPDIKGPAYQLSGICPNCHNTI